MIVDWLQSTVAHVTSPGDEVAVAPGGVLEEPLVEPLVGIMKYRVFTVSVCPCDMTLMEGNHLLRLVVSIVQFVFILVCYIPLLTHT